MKMSQSQPILNMSICYIANGAISMAMELWGINHSQHKVPLTAELKVD